VDKQALVDALKTGIPDELANDLAQEFLAIRQDVATATLGRGAPGKFVETVVQVFQALEQGGTYDKKPNVDAYLRGVESRSSSLPDGLRVCASRLSRAMYALRNKRSIAHKGEIDPNLYDLRLLFAGAQWVLAELLAEIAAISVEEAGRLIAEVELPVDGLVEAVEDRKIVHGNLTVPQEILILLMSEYPEPIARADVIASLDRRSAGSVRNAIKDLWKRKLLHESKDGKVVLTKEGMRNAISVAKDHAD
jgi:hypothetical protein